MNESKKKNIFTKKNIIIGVSILVVLLILVIVVFSSSSNEQKETSMKCTISATPNDIFESYVIVADIEYDDETINEIQYQYKYELTQDIINNVSIETIKESINKSFETSVTQKMNYEIESFGNTILINFLIDYVNFEESDFPKGDIFEEININSRDVSKFKSQIIESGGKCE